MTALGLLEGRVAIIAGAGRGIGASLSTVFAQQGAKVVAVDVDSQRAREISESVDASGGTAMGICADLRDPDAVTSIVEQTVASFGAIDALVNNAGGSFAYVGRKPITRYTEQDWDDILERNLRYVFLMSRAVVPVMARGDGGTIVNISSTLGIYGSALMVAYGAAKAGVNNLTRSLAVEFGPSGIRVNSLSLGHIEVPAGKGAPDDGSASALPLRRFGSPDEVAQVAAFLASDLASYVTGADITLDGGASALNVFTLSHTSALSAG
ncbi:MAG TPA: SDR family NAD(P)-dependent oxidoreductase [Solirubrobacteraceae bacterium]|nr:SDR family NAD(P)-dependent oxidoreductase [Solirubrobacteraceae bacterium]